MVHVNTFPSVFGERLRAERERLGFSQADLAQKMGIHRNTQARYEKAGTHPSPAYLTALRSLGVDIDYVLTGVRTSGESAGAAHRALVHLVDVIFDALSLTPHEKEFEGICHLAYDEIAAVWREGELRGEVADRATAALIKKSPLVIEEAVFIELIERIEFVLESTAIDLTPYDKGRAILRLYSLAKTQGKPLDLKTIRSVIEGFR
ncbi:MAG: helix-turn-helix transcriptional regulator [Thiobacillus sp.]|nr:helix-turn-helix transcriptional regulator [Thiobacillus sp.]